MLITAHWLNWEGLFLYHNHFLDVEIEFENYSERN